MRNEAPLTDFEGRESVDEGSVAAFSFTKSASAFDMADTGLERRVNLPWGREEVA